MRNAITERVAALRLQPVRPAGWWFDALLVGLFALLTGVLAAGGLLGLDTATHDWVVSHQTQATFWLARVFNFLGQGTPLTLISLAIALFLAVRRRNIWPILPVVAAFLITGIVIMPLKIWTERAAPGYEGPNAVDLFNSTIPAGEYDVSYPSGHLVNTVVWYGVIALLLAPWLNRTARLWLRIAPPAIVFVTTIYLDYHWLTDSVAGVLLGVFISRLIDRVPWQLPSREPQSSDR
ncbi:phosphatase PAP2 family protein [Asanoa hainanensis]|uniref:phosphatase PAP2 family protein n=1 Tax=Asanoa hainanensis TaxID=560556 RepID=UPI001FE5A43A|nr:phosphatase PAP2 family protein [Asanoa hainanensis]